MPAIYTRGGDKGATSLFGGSRVPKQSLRVEAYGAVDEANSFIGNARSLLEADSWMRPVLHAIQERLFTAAAELASDAKGREILANLISQDDVDEMEHLIDKCLEITGPQRSFIIPGADPASSALHLARTVIRRAERRVLTLSEREDVRPILIKYINRLSDTLYACARVQERRAKYLEIEKIVRPIIDAQWDDIRPCLKD